MKTRPDSRRGPWLAAAIVSVVTVSCGVYVKPRAPAMSDRARAFIHARADRSAPAVSKPGETPADQTVDVTGAVAQRGQFLIGPSLETLKQAIDAAGGLVPSAVALRIHPGDDALWKLFAAEDAAATAVEIPVSALSSAPPIYLRHGDVIDAAVADVPTTAVAAAAEEPPQPSSATAALPAQPSAPAPASTIVTEAPKPLTEPPPLAVDASKPAPESSYDLKMEFAKLRNEIELRLGTLRTEIDKLQAESARLAARLERPTTPPPQSAAAEAAAKATRSTKTASNVPAKPVEAARSEPEKPAEPMRAATVLVSGSVRSPGAYPVGDVKTVRGAVRAAGGRTDADMEAVEVRPDAQRGALVGMGLGMGMQPTKTVVNLVAVDAGKSGDVALHGGEVIFVPPASRSELAR